MSDSPDQILPLLPLPDGTRVATINDPSDDYFVAIGRPDLLPQIRAVQAGASGRYLSTGKSWVAFVDGRNAPIPSVYLYFSGFDKEAEDGGQLVFALGGGMAADFLDLMLAHHTTGAELVSTYLAGTTKTRQRVAAKARQAVAAATASLAQS